MNGLAAVADYMRAWNDHDPEAVLRAFAPGGSYLEPGLPDPLTGREIAAHVAVRLRAFPDLNLAAELHDAGDGRVVADWRMRGTHSGPLPDLPEPTGAELDLRGLDMITTCSQGITSVVARYDRQTLIEQLGMRALLAPQDQPWFYRGSLGRRGFTSVWVPYRLNAQHTRCPSCDRRLSIKPNSTPPRCPCGQPATVGSYF